MATLDWPVVLVPAKATWGIQSNTEAFTSPLNRSVQTVERPGARWKATLEFPPMPADQRGVLEGFLARMNGMAGRFRLWPHSRPGALGIYPQVDIISPDATILHATLFPPSAIAVRAGDFMEVNGELKMVTEDAGADASGNVNIRVAPPFRSYPSIGAPIVLYRPKATMMLLSDEFAVSVVPGSIAESVVISAVEVFV